MEISDLVTCQIKKEIRRYYQNKKAIEVQKKRLEKLYARLEVIQDDINSSNMRHNFKADVPGVSYDRVIVSGGGLPTSFMEKEIERIYRELEQSYKNTENEILRTKGLIRKLEEDSGDMDFYLSMLSEESKSILDMKYKEKKSLYQIAQAVCMSEATISRVLKDIFMDIVRLENYYKKT